MRRFESPRMPISRFPTYPFPATSLFNLALSVLTGRKRSFRVDACQMISTLRPAPVIEGREYIPQSGPGVITSNHYSRPGFWAPWFTAAITAAVDQDIYWTMTDALTYPDRSFSATRRKLANWMLIRVARTYHFNSMPPMPPAPGEVFQRAASVKRLLGYARANPRALLALAPEGGDQPGGVLHLPPDGFGRLALALAKLNMPFYPVGVYESEGCLQLRFGAPYYLPMDDFSNRHAADLMARQLVMRAIAACLPDYLRGEFRENALVREPG